MTDSPPNRFRLRKYPIPNVRVECEEGNLYHCHFFLTFNSGIYAGGEYHGLLDLPSEYPMAPPRVSFFTPSGRFETGERICVSFSDYHPELWNPSWGIESVLVGLQSFMQEECPEAIGSMSAPAETRRKLAAASHEFNMKDAMYVQLFAGDKKEEKFGDDEEKKDEDDAFCRYCRLPGGDLIRPCNCKGTTRDSRKRPWNLFVHGPLADIRSRFCSGSNEWAHSSCLAKWQYQAILNQNTHPKYQTGLEKICNVCLSEFRVKKHSREELMVSFTGAEIANMVTSSCLLVATEKSSKRNVELMEQYEYLVDRLQHWTKSVFLITECRKSPDGKKQLIVGINLTQKLAQEVAEHNARVLANLGLPPDTQQFVGGPVQESEPYVLFSVYESKLKSHNSECCWRIMQDKESKDFSVYYTSSYHYIALALEWARDAIIEARLYWGCACWDRVQLLGEIARGGWGLASVHIGVWTEPTNQCWKSTVASAIYAGANDFSKF